MSNLIKSLKRVIRSRAPGFVYKTAAALHTTYLKVYGPRSYQEIFVRNAAKLRPISGAKVLVVGANTGSDCRLFIEQGAAEVHGLDVISDVGREFQHKNVTYHKESIEKSSLPSDYFDLVFAGATMEHVPDVRAGFSEMLRVTSPDGFVYSVAAPLWHAPYGHHMTCFEGHPWVHLVFDRNELCDYAIRNEIHGERGLDIETVVDYMLNPDYFNMKPSGLYIEACNHLQGVKIIENEISYEHRSLLEHPLGRVALSKGYRPGDLLGMTHTFVGQKLA